MLPTVVENFFIVPADEFQLMLIAEDIYGRWACADMHISAYIPRNKRDKSLHVGAKPIVSQNSGVLLVGLSSEHLQGVLNLFHY